MAHKVNKGSAEIKVKKEIKVPDQWVSKVCKEQKEWTECKAHKVKLVNVANKAFAVARERAAIKENAAGKVSKEEEANKVTVVNRDFAANRAKKANRVRQARKANKEVSEIRV